MSEPKFWNINLQGIGAFGTELEHDVAALAKKFVEFLREEGHEVKSAIGSLVGDHQNRDLLAELPAVETKAVEAPPVIGAESGAADGTPPAVVPPENVVPIVLEGSEPGTAGASGEVEDRNGLAPVAGAEGDTPPAGAGGRKPKP